MSTAFYWFSGSLDFWDFWITRFLAQSFFAHCFSGSLFSCLTGFLGHMISVWLAFWVTGFLVHCIWGSVVFWLTGFLVFRVSDSWFAISGSVNHSDWRQIIFYRKRFYCDFCCFRGYCLELLTALYSQPLSSFYCSLRLNSEENYQWNFLQLSLLTLPQTHCVIQINAP